MKIAIFSSSKQDIKYFKNKLSFFNPIFFEDIYIFDHIKNLINCEIISASPEVNFTKEVISCLPNLKFIITQSTGFDHINLGHCRLKGIKVLNIPSYGSRSVAEFSMGLALSLAKKINIADKRTTELNFFADDLEGFDLYGKTLGIIGLGRIGKEMMLIGNALGMNVIARDILENRQLEKEGKFKYVSFEEVISKSDIISLHVPLDDSTLHMIDSKAFRLMKPSALIVNTARGEVINFPDLLMALENNLISGAALDVISHENDLFSGNSSAVQGLYKKMRQHNIIHTPHIASFSFEAQKRAMQIIVDNIISCVNGSPINVVN